MIQALGKKGINFFLFAGAIGMMSIQFCRALFRWPFEGKEFIRQVYAVGVKSLPLSIITGLSTGMVMTLQFAYGLKQYGAIDQVPKLVAYAMVRELGPVFIALLVGGKIASGFAAELGSMKVTDQIDAIRALGGDPIKKLIVPRVVAVLFALPLLTILADLFSFIGGSLIALIERYDLHKFDRGHNPYWFKEGKQISYRTEENRKDSRKFQIEREIFVASDLHYIIAKPGDSFKAIAKDLGLYPIPLAKYNELDVKTPLTTGAIIYLEPKHSEAVAPYTEHIVEQGESMYSIAQRYGMQVKSLYLLNDKSPDYVPTVGDKLRLR